VWQLGNKETRKRMEGWRRKRRVRMNNTKFEQEHDVRKGRRREGRNKR
jgi:hypothetical protein